MHHVWSSWNILILFIVMKVSVNYSSYNKVNKRQIVFCKVYNIFFFFKKGPARCYLHSELNSVFVGCKWKISLASHLLRYLTFSYNHFCNNRIHMHRHFKYLTLALYFFSFLCHTSVSLTYISRLVLFSVPFSLDLNSRPSFFFFYCKMKSIWNQSKCFWISNLNFYIILDPWIKNYNVFNFVINF